MNKLSYRINPAYLNARYMKHFLTLLMLLGAAVTPAVAQQARTTTEAIHFIKLANSFRALDRSPQAVNLLMRALPAVRSKNIYWEAVTYELLGLAHSEQENPVLAVRYLQQARNRYRRLNYEGSVWVLGELIRVISGKDLYAGIQFGSSGAKLAIFQTKLINGFYEKDIKSRIDIPNETDKLSRAGKDALITCIDSARRYNIPNERVFIVLGSEIGRSVVKMPDINNKQKLYNQLSSVLPKGVQMIDTTLTPMREAELFTLGAIPRNVWPTTSALEISGGGTMGGYFDNNRKFHAITVPFGPKALVSKIEEKRSLSINTFKREAQRVIRTIADTALVPKFYTQNLGLQKRKTVGVGGDITWALLTYLHPEKAGITAVPITLQDVARFKELALTDYQALTHPDLSRITDPAVRTKAEKDVSTMQSLLDEKQISAGALWLDTILRIYSTQPVPKRVVFIRNSDIGWVTGKFLETINQESTQTIARQAPSVK